MWGCRQVFAPESGWACERKTVLVVPSSAELATLLPLPPCAGNHPDSSLHAARKPEPLSILPDIAGSRRYSHHTAVEEAGRTRPAPGVPHSVREGVW